MIRDSESSNIYRKKENFTFDFKAEGERIAKKLARAGIASRREAESLIASGRVTLNGMLLRTSAVNVKKEDVITVDGMLLPQTECTRLWLYHKPAGLLTTMRDPDKRPTVFDNLPVGMPRVLSVGRLDMNTEGLLLLTNDGGLARVLELPATAWARRYRVRAHGKINQARLASLKHGIVIDGIFYTAEAFLERKQGTNVWLSMVLYEGRNHEIKNILGALSLTVTRMIRVSFGPFQLGALGVGMVYEVPRRILQKQLGDRIISDANADFDDSFKNFSKGDIKCLKKQDGDRMGSRPGRVKKVKSIRTVNVWTAPGARPVGRSEGQSFVRNERTSPSPNERTSPSGLRRSEGQSFVRNERTSPSPGRVRRSEGKSFVRNERTSPSPGVRCPSRPLGRV
jgi:23S rRNA pseudouridine2605 synthase